MSEIERLRGPRNFSRPLKRNRALSISSEMTELCRFYIYNSETSPSEKRQWVKTLNGVLGTASGLIREAENDEIFKRIELLEKVIAKIGG